MEPQQIPDPELTVEQWANRLRTYYAQHAAIDWQNWFKYLASDQCKFENARFGRSSELWRRDILACALICENVYRQAFPPVLVTKDDRDMDRIDRVLTRWSQTGIPYETAVEIAAREANGFI